MLKKEILAFFKGAANKTRREAFKTAFNSAMVCPRAGRALFLTGAEFSQATAKALNTALVGVEGWTPITNLNLGTANAVAAVLGR